MLICYDVSNFHVTKVIYNSHLRKYFLLFSLPYQKLCFTLQRQNIHRGGKLLWLQSLELFFCQDI
nr:MAG TPA: hypothetical protein [Caudoviricetes sp.]